MKRVLLILGVIVFLALTVFIVGKLLPVKHEATVSKEFKVDRLTLWDAVRDFKQYSEWRSSLTQLEVVNNSRWIEYDKRGDKITFGIIEEIPSQKLVTKILDDNLPFGGEWIFELRDSGKYTILQITEKGEVYSPVFRFIGYFFMDEKTTMNQYINDLEIFLSSK